MEQIDKRRALELLIDIVDQYGEGVVYERVPKVAGGSGMVCQYQDRGQPSCIVGHVLARAGVPMNTLYELDVCGTPADRLNRDVGVDGQAAQVLNAAQCVQDAGKTWGEALASAEAKYQRLLEVDAEMEGIIP
jgi:hypothetical protein